MKKQKTKTSQAMIDRATDTFHVLGDRTRCRILNTLNDGELNVTQLQNRLKIPQPTVSHHLGIMRMSGLVTTRREGKLIFYSLARDVFKSAMQTMEALAG